MRRNGRGLSNDSITALYSITVSIFAIGGLVGSLTVGMLVTKFGRYCTKPQCPINLTLVSYDVWNYISPRYEFQKDLFNLLIFSMQNVDMIFFVVALCFYVEEGHWWRAHFWCLYLVDSWALAGILVFLRWSSSVASSQEYIQVHWCSVLLL